MKGVSDEMDGANTIGFCIRSSDHERSHVMKKLDCWLKMEYSFNI